MKKILFISDLHLDEQHPEMTELFLRFLKEEANLAETLYILGDFFEMWIGDDDLSSFNLKIINALHAATNQGLPIYIMHGNRDFLLGKKFLKMTGCKLLPDEFILNLFGEPTLLMHGDTLCTLDTKYLAFRKKSRTWLYKKLVLLKALEKRRELAQKMRAASREHTRNSSYEIMDVTPNEVLRVMQKHKVQHLIHGHTHREGVHNFEIKQQPATRTVLGAWHAVGSVLICAEDGTKKLIKLI